MPFFDPVPDGPGRFALFRAPVDRLPDVVFLPRGASGFAPWPFPSDPSSRVYWLWSRRAMLVCSWWRYRKPRSMTTADAIICGSLWR